MPNFYVTFGQQYRDEPHPVSKKIHPDGYLKFVAVDYATARDEVFELLGPKWAMMYSEDIFNFHYFPMGEITLCGALS